ncbi:hypothetical protein BU16DRAFT_302035 [Lophium mytilinum]|uniref:Uncharacterized protein n=1 Tax=Lophium mytilinum TaxID=390894 RepID=A0A6A6R1K7_9PEZI|nr:hypothetical protein BU16DRAFT_302035 [Lophium mytilinum]
MTCPPPRPLTRRAVAPQRLAVLCCALLLRFALLPTLALPLCSIPRFPARRVYSLRLVCGRFAHAGHWTFKSRRSAPMLPVSRLLSSARSAGPSGSWIAAWPARCPASFGMPKATGGMRELWLDRSPVTGRRRVVQGRGRRQRRYHNRPTKHHRVVRVADFLLPARQCSFVVCLPGLAVESAWRVRVRPPLLCSPHVTTLLAALQCPLSVFVPHHDSLQR